MSKFEPEKFKIHNDFVHFKKLETCYFDLRICPNGLVYYNLMTCWWAFDIFYTIDSQKGGLPCGPRGEPLLEIDAYKFTEAVKAKDHDLYGKYGLTAFAAAFHGNILTGPTHDSPGKPVSFESWDMYNEVIQANLDDFLLKHKLF